MKGSKAIERTKEILRTEFEQRKVQKLEGMKRHRRDLEDKISRLQEELNSLNSKIEELENSTFRADFLSEESRKAQREASKQSRT